MKKDVTISTISIVTIMCGCINRWEEYDGLIFLADRLVWIYATKKNKKQRIDIHF